MATDFVGAEHEFHSADFARGWAERFTPTPDRLRLFALIRERLMQVVPAEGTIVELGIGPGYLARHLLERMPRVSYLGIDFSRPMLDIARERLKAHAARVGYLRADLVDDAWEEDLARPVHAVVSTWALHDLGSPESVATVYARSYRALDPGGLLLNGDFIKPDQATQVFEGGRFPVIDHLALLDGAGFSSSRCLGLFEEELENPTAAQNYACLSAGK